MNKHLEKAEQLNLVADSMAVRLELVKKLDNGTMTLEQVQEELKKIKKQGKKKVLLIRQDFSRNRVFDLEYVKANIIALQYKNMNDNIEIKKVSVKVKKI